MKRKRQQEGQASDNDEIEDPGKQDEQEAAEESEDEAEYYRQAVGEEPDEGIICWLAFAVICCGKHVFYLCFRHVSWGKKEAWPWQITQTLQKEEDVTRKGSSQRQTDFQDV